MALEMGQEMAEADGITIGTLLVDDDVVVKDSTYTVGRRGMRLSALPGPGGARPRRRPRVS